MIVIRNLCKIKENIQLNHINLSMQAGELTNLVCSIDVSNLLVQLIIGGETPAKGEVLIDGSLVHHQHHNHNLPYVGLIFFEEGFYERMTVASYLRFFHKLLSSQNSYHEIMVKLGLMDLAEKKIAMLSSAQKRRLSLARESLKDLKLLIFQEPLFNMDKYEAKIIMTYLDDLIQRQVTVLTTSNAYKDALLLGGKAYTVDESGIEAIQNDASSEEPLYSSTDAESRPTFKIDKIPAKIEDRILLFNPIEIDYIESENGFSFLNIRGERFACSMTLKELEGRLQHLGFFKCHRSYLVNLQKIKEIITWSRNSYSLILEDKKNSAIPLSKNRIDQMKLYLNI